MTARLFDESTRKLLLEVIGRMNVERARLLQEILQRHRTMKSDQLRDRILTQVYSLAKRGFNWDGTNDLPIRPDVSRLAERLLHRIDGICLGGDLPEPLVNLQPDGTLELHFASLRGDLYLALECDDVILFIRTIPPLTSDDSGMTIEGIVRCLSGNSANGIGPAARDEIDGLLDGLVGFHRRAML